MKFKINVKKFLKAILPVIEVAGVSERKCNIEAYLPLNRELIEHLEENMAIAVKSVLVQTGDKQQSKEIAQSCANALSSITQKSFPFKRITINADCDKIVVLASHGNVAAKVSIQKEEFTSIGYEYGEKGVLTLESNYLKQLLTNVKRWGTAIIADVGSNKAKIYPDSDDNSSRQFPVFSYHAEEDIPRVSKKICVVDQSLLVRSFRAVRCALDKHCRDETYKYILFRISKKQMRFFAGNGELFASYTVNGINSSCPNMIEVLLGIDDIGCIIKSLDNFTNNDVVIKFKKAKNADYLLFEQDNTVLSVCCENDASQYSPVADYFDYDCKYKFKTLLSDWALCMGKSVNPTDNTFPIVKLGADIQEGYFIVIHHEYFEWSSIIDFIYTSNVKYYHPTEMEKKNMDFTCFSKNIWEMIKNGKEDDIISIEFGTNNYQADETEAMKDSLKKMLQVKYPVRQIRKTGTEEQLSLLFSRSLELAEYREMMPNYDKLLTYKRDKIYVSGCYIISEGG